MVRWKTTCAFVFFFFCEKVSNIMSSFFLLMQKEKSLFHDLLTLPVCSSVSFGFVYSRTKIKPYFIKIYLKTQSYNPPLRKC